VREHPSDHRHRRPAWRGTASHACHEVSPAHPATSRSGHRRCATPRTVPSVIRSAPDGSAADPLASSSYGGGTHSPPHGTRAGHVVPVRGPGSTVSRCLPASVPSPWSHARGTPRATSHRSPGGRRTRQERRRRGRGPCRLTAVAGRLAVRWEVRSCRQHAPLYHEWSIAAGDIGVQVPTWVRAAVSTRGRGQRSPNGIDTVKFSTTSRSVSV
jgi:hypothetical protein